jgi:hypothetical protein
MDYGKTGFQENLQLIGDPASDPLMWNISAGLLDLAESLESEAERQNRKLDAILALLQGR